MRRPPLPDFDNPPVTEVALSMQFEEIADFRSIYFGLLWQTLGPDRFPTFEEQPPVQRTVERFGTAILPEGAKFELLEMPPVPRYLFVSADGTEVVQIQQDRFTVNWRKRSPDNNYPRFERLATLFEEQSLKFQDFLDRYDLGKIVVTQAEVTYVNRIEQQGEPRKLQRVFSVFSGVFSDDFLQEPEETYISFRFPLVSEQNRVGRLYIDVSPENPGDKDGPLKMVMLARGKPVGADRKSAADFFALGRKYIVSGFASITSREAQQTWGRRDDAGVSDEKDA
ncbi:MAG: TIGR04255 family protein [Acidobacteriota bacterium]|nr:TIGR04255 family protein [Acidobacteriota bacterium]